MIKDFSGEYKDKLRTPEEAVSVIKSGDWIDYTSCLGKPELLDKALAARRDELYDVKIRGNLLSGPIAVAECDESKEHFIYHSWHCSSYERRLCDRGLCYYIPMVFYNNAAYYEFFLNVNVVMVSVTPMDEHGYFNFSVNTGVAAPIARMADIVIVEVNEHLPKIRGGYDECIHISEVDYIVEGVHESLPDIKAAVPTDEDKKIAELILPYLVDGSTLQLGIGSTPNAVGEILAESDLKDLGMHTELCSDAYLKLYLSGKLSGLAGLVFGGMTRCENEYPNSGFELAVILEHWAKKAGCPCASGLLCGHIADNRTLLLGARYELDAGAGTLKYMETIKVC